MQNSHAPRFRLQFSLQALLVVMLLVGVGLVVYRWPWVVEGKVDGNFPEAHLFFEPVENFFESSEGAPLSDRLQQLRMLRMFNLAQLGVPELLEMRSQTTYRRGWNGKPERHGPAKFWKRDGTLVGENRYQHDEMRQTIQFDANGHTVSSNEFKNGVLHGLSRWKVGPRSWTGTYDKGKRTGVWKQEFRDGDSLVTATQPFVADRPHGEWTWKHANHQILQSAHYEHGRLTLWNGQAVDDELRKWCDTEVVDQLTREQLFTLNKDRAEAVSWSDFLREVAYDESTVALGTRERGVLILHSPNVEISYGFLEIMHSRREPERTLGEGILQEALYTSRTIDFRFGVVCVVPISSRELTCHDRTGVMQVQFPEGSLQAKSWSELRAPQVDPDPNKHHMDVLRRLFAGSGIEVDTSEISATDMKRQPTLTHNRLRRDILGLWLGSHDWSCEQRGNKIILHLRPIDAAVSNAPARQEPRPPMPPG